jgi:hypothetical protein
MLTTLDLSARYTVAGYGGIAFYLLGYAQEWTSEEWSYIGEGDPDDESSYLYSEPEQIEDTSRVRAVMVGDDFTHVINVDDLTKIGDDDYCHECGQIGCTGDFRPRGDD